MEREIRCKGQTIPYELKKSNRKSVGIKITLDGSVIVTAPLRMEDKIIEGAVESKSRWILTKVKQMQKAREEFAKDARFLQDSVYYLGQPYQVDVVLDTKFYNITVEQYGEKIYLMTNFYEEHSLKKALEMWYRCQTKEIIKNRLEYYQPIVGAKENSFKVRDQKTRWGSCSSKRNLNFNWRLSMAPLSVLDYVVVHELCHIKQMNHSEQFWVLVAQALPDYKESIRWLKEHNRVLEHSIQGLYLSK